VCSEVVSVFAVFQLIIAEYTEFHCQSMSLVGSLDQASILLGLALCSKRLYLQSLWRCVNIFTELSLAGLAVDLVDIECYDAMGSVIRPLKLYPKWSIMCRVGHCTIPVLLVVVHHYNVLIVMLPHINQSTSLYFSQICNNNDNSCTKYRVHIHIHSYAINISFVDLMSVLWISVLLTQTSSIGNVITVCSAFNIQQFLCQ